MPASTYHLEYASVCVVDADGRIVREAKILSEPDALIAWFGEHGVAMERIGLEAGPLSQWLHAGNGDSRSLCRADRDAPRACRLQDDAGQDRQEGRPGHCAVDAAWLVQTGPLQISCRPGGAGAADRPVGARTRRTYAGRIRELIAGHSTLEAIATALLKVREALVHEFAGFERKLRAIAREDDNALRLMTTPGVGVLVALTFVAGVDAPERFRSSRAAGPHFGLTPKKNQSGETDHSGRTLEDRRWQRRTALYEAANVILTRPVKGSDLKGWALAVARRAGPKKARVALARKLAVVLHCMLRG